MIQDVVYYQDVAIRIFSDGEQHWVSVNDINKAAGFMDRKHLYQKMRVLIDNGTLREGEHYLYAPFGVGDRALLLTTHFVIDRLLGKSRLRSAHIFRRFHQQTLRSAMWGLGESCRGEPGGEHTQDTPSGGTQTSLDFPNTPKKETNNLPGVLQVTRETPLTPVTIDGPLGDGVEAFQTPDGKLRFTTKQCAELLGCSNQSKISHIYKNHESEFSGLDASFLFLPPKGKGGANAPTRTFSTEGLSLLCMFARTERAKVVRAWAKRLMAREIWGEGDGAEVFGAQKASPRLISLSDLPSGSKVSINIEIP